MRRVVAFHVIDVLFLGGEDLRDTDIKTRNELAKVFCKAMNKTTVPEYVTLRAKEMFGLEKLPDVLNQLKPRMLKGAGGKFRLTQDIGRGQDCLMMETTTPSGGGGGGGASKYFCPTGILLQRVVREPFMIAFSKSQQKKYWFNTLNSQSVFECPKAALIDFKTSF